MSIKRETPLTNYVQGSPLEKVDGRTRNQKAFMDLDPHDEELAHPSPSNIKHRRNILRFFKQKESPRKEKGPRLHNIRTDSPNQQPITTPTVFHVGPTSQKHHPRSTATCDQERQERLEHQPKITSTVPKLPSFEFPSNKNDKLELRGQSSLWTYSALLAISITVIVAIITGRYIVLNLVSIIVIARAFVVIGKWLDFITKWYL